MKSASCCSPSSVVLSPRSSEANALDARLRSALNFSSFSFDSCSRRRSPVHNLAGVLEAPRRNQTFHEMVVVIGEIDVARRHERHS